MDLQPPLPLQVFLPLQPLSPALQPPWPLQLFMPLQPCLPRSPLGALVPGELVLVSCALATTPDSNPVMAAATRSVRCVLFIIFCPLVSVFTTDFHPPRRCYDNESRLAKIYSRKYFRTPEKRTKAA